MQKMLKVSKISENDTIEDILFSNEWQEFAKNLAERNLDKVVRVCITHCKKEQVEIDKKIEEIIMKKILLVASCSYSNDRFRSVHHPDLDVSWS